MAKYTFLLFYECMINLKNKSYIIHGKYELYHFVDARGVTNLSHEMRTIQGLGSLEREYFNTILKKIKSQNIGL